MLCVCDAIEYLCWQILNLILEQSAGVNNVIDLSFVIALEAAVEFGRGAISKSPYLLEKVVDIRAADGSFSEALLVAFRPLVHEKLSNCCLSLVLTVTNQAEHWTMHRRVLLFSVIGISDRCSQKEMLSEASSETRYSPRQDIDEAVNIWYII